MIERQDLSVNKGPLLLSYAKTINYQQCHHK